MKIAVAKCARRTTQQWPIEGMLVKGREYS